MRIVLLMVLAGCLERGIGREPDPINTGPGPEPQGTSCTIDSDCTSGSVCSHGFGCWQASQVYTAHVSWTIKGMPATTTACDALAALTIDFASGDITRTGFEPLACAEGEFTLPNVPTLITTVKIGSRQLGWKTAKIDPVTGEAALDLTF